MPAKKDDAIKVRVSSQLKTDLSRIAEGQGRTLANLVEFVLTRYVDTADEDHLQEPTARYRVQPSESDIQAAVRAATETAVREILGKTPRR